MTEDDFEASFLPETREISDALRSRDWSGTPLGPMQDWSSALRTAVGIALGSSRATFLVWGPSHTTLYNDAAARLLGDRHPDVLGRPLAEIFEQAAGDLESVLDRSLHEDEVDRQVELAGTGSDSRSFDVTGVPGPDGETVGLMLSALDETASSPEVTELEKTSAALRESERLYRTLFESVDQGIGILEMLAGGEDEPVDFRWLEVNEAFERHSGLADPVGRTARELTSEIDEMWFEKYAEVVRSGRRASFVNYIRETDRWVEVEAVPVGGRHSRRVAVLFSDVSERRHRERNMALLNELNDDFSRIADPEEIMGVTGKKLADHLGVSRVTFSEIFVDQERFENIYEWREDEMPDATGVFELKNLETDPLVTALEAGREVVVDDIGADRRTAPNADTFASFDVGSLVYVPHLSDGRWKFQLAVHHSEPHEWRDAEVELLCDLTSRLWWRLERAYAERELREANRRKDEFLAVLSHELRNPLAPIAMGLDLLEAASDGSEQERRAREIIRRQVNQLTRLVDDLLDVNRIDSGKIELDVQTVDLGELVEQTVRDHQPQFEDHDVALDYRGPDSPVSVDADPERLAQVVGNLLQNAVKFTDPGDRTTVEVSANRQSTEASVRVADTGHGIDSETLSKLFDPFVQADSAREYAVGGLGLGLSLVEGLVELHDGDIEVHSAGPGQGAEFVVSLPLKEETMTTESTQRPEREETGPVKILVIEDNADIAEMMTKVLEMKDYSVETELSGPGGLERARQMNPDVIICDIGLPEMDGYEVARTIREDSEVEPTVLIAISGYARPEDVEESQQAGFAHHISKPPDLDQLDEIIRQEM